eukprot:1256294-Rhodomonas_salina.1
MGRRGEPCCVPRATWSMRKREEKKRREERHRDVRPGLKKSAAPEKRKNEIARQAGVQRRERGARS